MGLIVSRYAYTGIMNVPEGASKFHIAVGMDYLSESYDLDNGSKVLGTILSCQEGGKRITHLTGISIVFILQKKQVVDYLFISRDDWNKHFRDWGSIKSGYILEVKLTAIIREDGTVTQELYQKRDVRV